MHTLSYIIDNLVNWPLRFTDLLFVSRTIMSGRSLETVPETDILTSQSEQPILHTNQSDSALLHLANQSEYWTDQIDESVEFAGKNLKEDYVTMVFNFNVFLRLDVQVNYMSPKTKHCSWKVLYKFKISKRSLSTKICLFWILILKWLQPRVLKTRSYNYVGYHNYRVKRYSFHLHAQPVRFRSFLSYN